MRTKAERRQWWSGLKPEQQGAYVKKQMEKKAAKRRAASIAIMEKAEVKRSCSDCLHGGSGSCTDNLPNGCEHWFRREVQC